MSIRKASQPATHHSSSQQRCVVPGCGRLAEATEGKGVARYHCRYHVQHKSRHGSHWHTTYKAPELRPYIRTAERWINDHRHEPAYQTAYWQLEYLFAGAGRVDPAMNLRGRSAEYRARVAFARLRAASIPTQRIIAIYLGIAALIEDDFGSHRTREFRIVQAAKAVHRLASGTHRKWDSWDPRTGGTRPIELHAYPRSSGHVLRKIGEALEKACDELAHAAAPEVIAMCTERFGAHPSHSPVAKAS
ncbi:hypothetical protein Rleg9DRAFT_3672 [Rhizobium leguminosarum bv. trifolii WSM597]|uniref:Uncharacterized protein n=1 Tax=Rhizobium leguminosarum bv. trifolii WSM597 TaxID=754764 RepID=J0H4A4_RHILT|nr:hypothetical protein Rleg9DRAFT_3672 [Rhizobium leguminosarum bv. trifolii WSM597]